MMPIFPTARLQRLKWLRRVSSKASRLIPRSKKDKKIIFPDINTKEDKNNMGTLKQVAKEHSETSKGLMNIADLDVMELSLEVHEANGTDKQGVNYVYKYIDLNGQRYRIPVSVISLIKQILNIKPDTERVSVNKTGTGLNTRYTVNPL